MGALLMQRPLLLLLACTLASQAVVAAREAPASTLTGAAATSELQLNQCPEDTPIAVRDAGRSIVKCLTPGSSCPKPYTLPMYDGMPSAIKECRLADTNCTKSAPFTMSVTNSTDDVIGCVNPASNSCPFAAFRQASKSFVMEACKQTTTCPSDGFSVPAKTLEGQLAACLALSPTPGACPSTPAANFPIEAVAADATAAAAAAASRTVECLPAGLKQCDPARFPLTLYKQLSGSATGAAAAALPAPSIVECRQVLARCDLTAASMGNTPNAGTFNIPLVLTVDSLVGCMAEGSTQCPMNFPVSERGPKGVLLACRPATDSPTPCLPNGIAPVPARDAAGKWDNVCLARVQSCAASYPTHPVTIRNTVGDIIECRRQLDSCPTTEFTDTDGTGKYVPSMPLYAASAFGTPPVITDCYPPAAVGNACTLTIGSTAYTTPIKAKSSSSSSSSILGCIAAQSGGKTSICPEKYPFAVRGVVNGASYLESCAPAGDSTACAAPYIPATDNEVVIGCITPVGSPGACPSDIYPVTVAVGVGSAALECMTATSKCYRPTQPFSLFKDGQLKYCINPQGVSSCDQFASINYNGPPIFNNAGTSVLGCMHNSPAPQTCPTAFPFMFKSSAEIPPRGGRVFQCRAGIDAANCTAAVKGRASPANTYTMNVAVNGVVTGCTQPAATAAKTG